MVLAEKPHQGCFVLLKCLKVSGEKDDVVGIAGVDDVVFMKIMVHFVQVNIGKERSGRRSGHHAVFFLDDNLIN